MYVLMKACDNVLAELSYHNRLLSNMSFIGSIAKKFLNPIFKSGYIYKFLSVVCPNSF